MINENKYQISDRSLSLLKDALLACFFFEIELLHLDDGNCFDLIASFIFYFSYKFVFQVSRFSFRLYIPLFSFSFFIPLIHFSFAFLLCISILHSYFAFLFCIFLSHFSFALLFCISLLHFSFASLFYISLLSFSFTFFISIFFPGASRNGQNRYKRLLVIRSR